MKRSLALVSAILALLSCSKVTLDLPGEGPDSPTVFNLELRHPAGTSTKAVKKAWSERDIVYVFFEGDQANYLKMTRTDSGWDYEQKPGKVQLGSGRRLTAIYLPFNTDEPVYDRGWKFPQCFAYYLAAEAIPYTIEADPRTDARVVNVSATLRTPDAIVRFLIPDEAPVSGKYFLMEPGVTPTSCEAIVPGGTVGRIDLRQGDPMPAMAVPGEGYYFYGILDAAKRGTPQDYDFSLVETDPVTGFAVTTSTQSFLGKTLYTEEEGFLWDVGVRFKTAFEAPIRFVDLGLPSRLKWATGNVKDGGITAPNEIGTYFSWMRASYDRDGTGGTDTAADLLGNDWRMPSREEFQELLDLCRWTWTTVGDLSGCQVTGPNGLSIFLPAAGQILDGMHGNAHESLYWSSTPGEQGTAYHLHVSSDEIITHLTYGTDGLLVRPVYLR